MKGQLSKNADGRQDAVEANMSRLGVALALLEHDALRLEQAIRRKENMRDLLEPVLADLNHIASSIRSAQSRLRGEWEDGQRNRWETD